MAQKTFKRPTQEKPVKDDAVVANTVNHNMTEIEPKKDNFVKFEDVQGSARGHNFPDKKIAPLKKSLGEVLNQTIDKSEDLLKFRVEDLTYLSLAIHPKELENLLIGLAPRKLVKSIRVYTQGKKSYLFAALDKNLIINKEEPTDLLSLATQSLSSKTNLDLLKSSIYRELVTKESGFNLILKDNEIGIILDLSLAMMYFTHTCIYEDVPNSDPNRMANAIRNTIAISEDIEFSGGKILVSYTVDPTKRVRSNLVFSVIAKNIVAANVSMALSRFEQKANTWLKNNVDYNAHLRFSSYYSLTTSLSTAKFGNQEELNIQKEKVNHFNALTGNSIVWSNVVKGRTTNVVSVPLVVLDDSFKAERAAFKGVFLERQLSNIPVENTLNLEAVKKVMSPILSGNIISFSFEDGKMGVTPDIYKLLVVTEFGELRDDFRYGIQTTNDTISYNMTA